MDEALAQRLERLRGPLRAAVPGARGLERLARNPECRRLFLLTLLGVGPAAAATRVYNEPERGSLSPFAAAAGQRFEKALFADNAAALLALCRDAGSLRPGERRVVNVPDRHPGSGPAARLARRKLSETLLQMKLRGAATAPHLIVKPLLTLRLCGQDFTVEPDALVASAAEPCYRVVEIKAYADRRGKTNPADLRNACRQAAVSVLALRQTLARLGNQTAAEQIPIVANLVLRHHGSNRPSLRPMSLAGELSAIERAFAALQATLESFASLLATLPPAATLADPRVLDRIPHAYRETCREHCALALCCERQALARGDLALLGATAREELAPAGTLDRALALLDGAPPLTAEESALQERLREALAAYQEGLRRAS